MGADKKYEIVNLNTRIQCKTRVAFMGDTVSYSEVLKPSILEGLAAVGKIKEAGSEKKSTTKSTKKSTSKTEEKSSTKKTDKKKSE